MKTIYDYNNNEFDKSTVINNMSVIQAELEEEMEKPLDKESHKRELELLYKQYLQGLRLCTGFVKF